MDGGSSETRIISSFNANWKFAKDLPKGTPYYDPRFDDDPWEAVTIPHTPRIEPLVVNDQWRGDAWYRKVFTVPARYAQRKVFIRFEGAMQIADVWLNGEHVGTHTGGYLPFAFDLTQRIRFGDSNLIAVRLNNEDNDTIPPGKPLATLDFNYFGGIYRNVDLVVTEDLYITDPILADVPGGGGVYVYSTEVSSDSARLNVYVHVQNDGLKDRPTSVRITLREPGQIVNWEETSTRVEIPPGGDHTFAKTYTLREPRLWSPDSPQLYELTAEVLRWGEPSDSVTTRIGIREFRFDAEGGFRVNGERVFLRGTNRHQEYPYVGYAIPDEAHFRDAVKIKRAGFDMVRLSHYPHSEAFMRAADEIGLILMDCIPGWQFFGGEAFQRHALRDIRDMARRDRNHPSVAFWEVSLNESGMDDRFMEKANAILREELPGQAVFTAGWIDHESYDLFIPARQHSRPPDYWSKYDRDNRPLFIAEYGDWEYYAQNAGFRQTEFADLKDHERSSRQLRGFGEKRLLQQALNYQEAVNSNRKGRSTIGHANWLMFDYNRGYADNIEASGISDIFRLPKFAHYFYRSQRAPAPLLRPPAGSGYTVFIANYWQPTSVTDVRVFSNTEEVALYLNGELLERSRPDSSRLTTHLNYPPFTFELGGFEPGTLRAVGYKDGSQVASHEVTTPGEAAKLKIEVDYSGVAVATEHDDLLFVYAHVLDSADRPVPGDSSWVEFTVRGSASLLGPNPVEAEAGIAPTLIRTRPSEAPGDAITVHAKSDGLEADSIEIAR